MKVTAVVDVLSHWCLAAWPALEAVRETAPLEIRLAPVLNGFPMGLPPKDEQWFYRRGTLAYQMTLRPDWYESTRTTTLHANAAVIGASLLGADLAGTMVATMRAALESGHKLGRREVAVEIVANIANVHADVLDEIMNTAEVGRILNEGNEFLRNIGCSERPSWYLENAAGDHVAMQGVWQAEPLMACVAALRSDEDAYRMAGTPPGI